MKPIFIFLFALLSYQAAAQTIRYVKQTASGTGTGLSWANASSNLQTIINASAIGDAVWVAAGTYKPTRDLFGNTNPTDPRDKTFYVKDGVKIYGGFAGTENLLSERTLPSSGGAGGGSILSGDFNSDDAVTGTGATLSITGKTENAYHVVLASAASSGGVGVTIDGFTIKGGNASGSSSITVNGNNIYRNEGGGIGTYFGTNTLSNNILSGNAATYGGGIYTGHGTNTLSNNTFLGNTAAAYGSGIYTDYGTNTLSNNTLLGNTAVDFGGGIYTYFGTNTLSNNTLSGNTADYGSGIYNNSSTNTLSNNTFSGNAATNRGGGIYTIYGTNTLKNNTLSGNSANYGGGVYTNSGTNTLSNNTLSGNKSYIGGGIYTNSGTNTLSNNILSGNTANYGGGIYTYEGTNTLINNTLSGNKVVNLGGGIYTYNGTNMLSNNTLSGNTADYGGGIYNYYSTHVLSNNINTLINNTLSENTANYGGGIAIESGTNTLSNNTLSGNTANNIGGGIYTHFSRNMLSNNIFWGNKKGTDATVVGADYYPDDINRNTFKNNLLQLAASNYLVSNSGNYHIGETATGNLFATDPLFANAADPNGADNIYRTADDGLQLLCGSPVLNTGTNTGTPTLDIRGNAIYNTTKDMGAYESQTDCANDIYTGTAACKTYIINNVSGNTWFHVYGVNGIIASINPNGENLGTLTVTVGDPTGSSTVNNEKFLGRNINITSSAYPTGNIPTAYSLKLYYYDTEFDDYKTATTNPTATLADLDIAWASGGTGCTLADYATSATTNGKIVKASVGEFDYGTGGNGFYLSFNLNHFTMFAPTISASANPLPVKLLTFTGYNKGYENVLDWLTATEQNNLDWLTATEQNNKGFEVERAFSAPSQAGTAQGATLIWKKIGFVRGAGNSNTEQYYSFTDNLSALGGLLPSYKGAGGNYYCLRQIDYDGNYTYSNTIFIKNKPSDAAIISIYPNPVTDVLNILAADKNQSLIITDLLGRTIIQQNILPETVDMSSFVAGVYFISAGNQVFKVVKE